MQSADVAINVAKDLLGHKTIQTTSRVYTHLSPYAFANASLKVLNFQDLKQKKKKQRKPASGR